MKQIKLEVSIEEANLILDALGNLPFVKVYGLIGKIQEQAGQQMNGTPAASDEVGSENLPPTVNE